MPQQLRIDSALIFLYFVQGKSLFKNTSSYFNQLVLWNAAIPRHIKLGQWQVLLEV